MTEPLTTEETVARARKAKAVMVANPGMSLRDAVAEVKRQEAEGREPLDLDAIRADLDYASNGIDGPDTPYNPHALSAMRAAEKLLAEVDRLTAALTAVTRERDLAIAHDRQPYPTAWAYEQACAAREKHRARADTAEAEVERLRADLAANRGMLTAARQHADEVRAEVERLTIDRDSFSIYTCGCGAWTLDGDVHKFCAECGQPWVRAWAEDAGRLFGELADLRAELASRPPALPEGVTQIALAVPNGNGDVIVVDQRHTPDGQWTVRNGRGWLRADGTWDAESYIAGADALWPDANSALTAAQAAAHEITVGGRTAGQVLAGEQATTWTATTDEHGRPVVTGRGQTLPCRDADEATGHAARLNKAEERDAAERGGGPRNG